MKDRMINLLAALGAATLVTGFVEPTMAAYPEKPIRLIIPYAPGGGTDTFARRLADSLGKELGQEIAVENIGGAGGNIGMKQAADADPDGYTLVFALGSQFAINVSLFDQLPYDPITDFEPISLIGSVPYVLVVNYSLGVNSVQGLIDLAKEKPDELSYASSGVGSGAHLATELLKTSTGIEMEHIPYKGAGAAYPDLLSGRVPVMFATYAPIQGYIQEGRLIPIGVSSVERDPALPDIAPVADTVDGFDATTWYALAAPAGTPADIVQTVYSATLEALKEPELRAQLESDATTIIGSTPEEFRAYMPTEIEKWRKVVEASGAKAQ